MVKGYVLFVWGSINLRSQQWNGLAVHCRFQRKENTNHELWLKFLGRGGWGGGQSFNFRSPDYFFTSNQYIITKDFNSFGGAMLWVAPPLQEKKREETAKIEMKVRKKKLRFLFLVILIFLFKYDETIFKFY